MACPCFSGKPYAECCEPYHLGFDAPNALVLMRSRYSAYAKGDVAYIQRTQTIPGNSTSLQEFCKNTQFTGLTIQSFEDGETEAFVTFTAHLMQNGQDVSFQERSRFLKLKGCWCYVISTKT